MLLQTEHFLISAAPVPYRSRSSEDGGATQSPALAGQAAIELFECASPHALPSAIGSTIVVGLVRAHGQVAPARHPLQADRDDGPFGDLHRRQLAVPRAYSSCARSCSVPARRISARPRNITQPSRVQSSSYRSTAIATIGLRSMLRTRLSAAPSTRVGFSSMVM